MGKASERYDSHGREKIKCRLCKLYFHRLDVHLGSKHGMTVSSYLEQFPGAKVMSAHGEMVEAASEETEADGSSFETKEVAAEEETYKFGCAELRGRTELSAYDQRFVPIHDEGWHTGAVETQNLEYLALGIQDNQNVLVVGPPGVGKTTLVRELAAIINQPLRRMPINGEMRLSDLVGSKELVANKAGGVVTQYGFGILPDAAKCGHWLLADEFDSAPPQVTFVLHSVLESPRQLTLNGEEQDVNEHFRFIATANTLGYGDETGLYAGTGPMNEALLDRFGVVIRVDYPKRDDEVKILTDRTGVRAEWAGVMVTIANTVREAQKNAQTMVSMSPRRLVMWSAMSKRMNDPRRAAKITVTNKLQQEDRQFIEALIQRHFGGSI